MKKILSFLLVCIFIALSACGFQPTPAPSPTPSETPSVSVLPSPSATVSETPSPSPVKVSFTTGLSSEAEYKPVGVMIENSPGARPQTNLQKADVVYEALAEGAITRFFCIFNDNMPEIVGPVRSLRIYYMNIHKEWDSILVHYGGASTPGAESYVYGKSSEYIKIRVDGLKGKYNQYFWRVDDKGVHDVRTDLTKVQKLYNYTPNPRKPWQFDTNVNYTSASPVTKVMVPFTNAENFVWYSYDGAKDMLIRNMGKDVFKDAVTKSAIEVKNLVIQYCKYKSLNDAKGRRNIVLTGTGEAEFIIGGKLVKGTWERKDLNSQTFYYDQNGKEIVFKPGNAWVEVHPDTIKVKYSKS